jgi:hypothetical protein
MSHSQHPGRARASSHVGVAVAKGLGASGHFEPSLALRLLPRCEKCGAKHPLAHEPPRHDATCIRCGAPAATPGPYVDIPAAITGRSPSAIAARACLAIGRFLHRISKRLDP